MPAVLLPGGRTLLRAVLCHARRSTGVQQRALHASSTLQARRKGGGRGVAAAQPSAPTSAVFDGPGSLAEEGGEDDFEEWFNKMQVSNASRKPRDSEKASVQNLMPIDIDGEEDADAEEDEETQEFLSHVDELFALDPTEFEKRMKASEKREAAARRPAKRRSQGEDEDDEDDEDDEESDRVTEKISKKKLLKALSELNPTKSKKNLEGMPMARTAAKTKLATPLEKNTRKNNVEKASYRQARVELTVLDFVQNLLLEESDTTGIDVIPSFVEASVSPDLRRVVLFWEPVRLNSSNQTISKRKVAGVATRLTKQERWVRAQVTRFLNLKYSPVVEFRQRKANKSDEARALFDSEMQWLDRFH